MTGDRFIDLAARLTMPPNQGEEHYRSAVSRAYYGAFHAVREFLAGLGFRVPTLDAHEYLAVRLQQSGHDEAQSAGSKLSTLRSARNIADYDLQNPLFQSVKNARIRVEAAKEIVAIIRRCGSDTATKAAVKRGIEAYENLFPYGR